MSTSPHCAPRGSVTRTPGISKMRSASNAARLGVDGQRRLRDEAEPAPLEEGPQLEDARHRLQGGRVAVPGHDPLVLILDARLACVQLTHDHQDRFQNVERFEAGDDDRFAVVPGDEFVRTAAGDRRNVTGPHEPVDAHVGRIENRAHRRNDRHVIAEDGEVPHAQLAGSQDRQRRRGRRRLEADREEADVFVRGSARRCEARRAASRPCGCRRRGP